MITLLMTYHCKSGKAQEFLDTIHKEGIPQASRSEEGCMGYRYYRPLEGEDEILLVEQWKDQAALDFHAAKDYFKRLQDLKADLVEKTDKERLDTKD